mmetsp:Transcript_12454/g.22046  ORF Transcript_12454/g.22046 Transcript_12454/m.22046 type:complete len:214 (+) Transcript_12454:123-764(+)|eukprot:CAMPEP_0197632886 /NCGR_PEP_ID=MMETSP1338-20131121/9418_1 /TAXON_ID=43686 ORGANISM="Pelagodinium beii, Strain RCC1491" /NCGR_SAMPLE_ID=MMETSP1338 /ASSEMBLY_ACC=CAM_ASM_000754 /LENGTH=213 /DNA_ID=CAMNT_0043204461 /DNA_START=29 /DNA_END=670 /DNA_ORIENTATION=-
MPAGAVIWIHGLGDSGDGWRGAFGPVERKLPNVKFHHPDAPVRPVTCNGGGRCPSWFDIVDIPVVLAEPDDPKDIEESVKTLHGLLDKVQSEGVAPGDIVIGGFSQGGTMSLLAGLKYPKTLGGVISISGWCANRANLSAHISAEGKKTPVLMCCGDGDPVVDFSITKKSSEMLQAILGEGIEVLCPRRGMHQPDGSEMQRVMQFMVEHLPSE